MVATLSSPAPILKLCPTTGILTALCARYVVTQGLCKHVSEPEVKVFESIEEMDVSITSVVTGNSAILCSF